MTYQIIYASASSTPMQLDELQALLTHAQDSNTRQGITGALVYVDGFFLQILEGQREDVQKLMDRIAGDLRHETVTVLQEGETSTAAFADWRMAFVSATPQQIARWAGLGAAARVPEVLKDMREDRQVAERVARRILSALLGGPEPTQAP